MPHIPLYRILHGMNAPILLCSCVALLCFSAPNAIAEEPKTGAAALDAAEKTRLEKVLATSREKLLQVDKAKNPGEWIKLTDRCAFALDALGHPQEAVTLRRAVLRQAERLYGRLDQFLVLHILHLAEVLAKTGRPEEAEKNYLRVIAIKEKHGAGNQSGLAMILGHYAKFLETQQRPAEAWFVFLRVLEIHARAFARSVIRCARTQGSHPKPHRPPHQNETH